MGEGRILADGAIGDGRMLAEKRHIFVLFAARILAQLVYFVSRGDSEGHPDADVRSPKSHEVCVVVLSVSVGQCSQHSSCTGVHVSQEHRRELRVQFW